ncbi:MAG: hypothetical protein KKA16_07470 [Alphaproteobacteria bacterium]|nr:hypothetical protein [Alphaproteobacteria bacterium]MBU2379677.1 hypothetical protein [Alphaproteobacteria bacterium]
MSAIRPDIPQTLPVAPTGPSAQAKAAQAAFFRAALSEVQMTQAGPQTALSGPSIGPSSEPDNPRTPRPGQLLDIRV